MSKPIPPGEPVTGDMTRALDSRFLNAIVLQGALDKKGADFLAVEIDRIEMIRTGFEHMRAVLQGLDGGAALDITM